MHRRAPRRRPWRPCRPLLATAHAFTLVELMVSTAVASVVALGVLSAASWQVRNAVQKMAEADAHVQALALVSAIAYNTNRCGFGFGHANDAAGWPATGICSSTAAPVAAGKLTAACQARDNGGANDRLRIHFLQPGLLDDAAPSAPSAGPCGTDTSPADPTMVHLDARDTLAQNYGGTYAMGGPCQGGGTPSAGTDMVSSPFAAAMNVRQCARIYVGATTTDPWTGASLPLSCPNGYAPGYAWGYMGMTEFYSGQDATTKIPQLRAKQLGTWPATYAVAYPDAIVAQGITRFEVRYGFDVSSARSHQLLPCPSCTEDPLGSQMGGPRSWCREVRAADQGGSCVLQDDAGNTLSTAELRNRIIALHVTFDVISTGQTSAATAALGIPANAKKFTFAHLFALPNMVL